MKRSTKGKPQAFRLSPAVQEAIRLAAGRCQISKTEVVERVFLRWLRETNGELSA